MAETVGIAIAAVPGRPHLPSAIRSIMDQSRPVHQIEVAVDVDRDGAWVTRNRAARALTTDWVGFLDDDDELLPDFVEHLLHEAEWHGASMVWGWFDVIGGVDPFPAEFRGKQYEAPHGHCVPITYLVRREVLFAAMDRMGGFQADPAGTGNWGVQDEPMIDALHEELERIGSRSLAVTSTVWAWRHWGLGSPGVPGNTSGLPGRW